MSNKKVVVAYSGGLDTSYTVMYLAKEKGYDFILCKSSGIDNVLYANEAYDVTDEVVKALNKRYSKQPSKKDAKK